MALCAPRTPRQSIAAMRSGDHACLVHRSEDERRAAVELFVQAGLAAGEKVVYVTSAPSANGDLGWLLEAGEDRSLALSSGQLEIRHAGELYLAGGGFDTDRAVMLVRADVESATAGGFSGYRIAAEMDWLLDSGTPPEELFAYEERIDGFFSESGAVALCQYDHRRFEPRAIRDAECVHPLVLADRAADELAVYELLIEPGAEGEIVVRGQVDHSNRESLERSLTAAAARRRDLRLDVRELSFIDGAGLRAIGQTAERLQAAGGSLTLLHPQPLVKRLLGLFELAGPVQVEDDR